MPRISQCRLGTYSLKVMCIWFLVSAKTVHPSIRFLYVSLLNCENGSNVSSQEIPSLKQGLSGTMYTQSFLLRREEGAVFPLVFLDSHL